MSLGSLSITVQNMLPNTDQAHNKHMWNILCNFNQVYVITPWWRILCDPKHVGVICNVCLLDFYITQILTSITALIECISWLIKVTNNNNDARWKPEINVVNDLVTVSNIIRSYIDLFYAFLIL